MTAPRERPAIEQRLELIDAHGDRVAFTVENDRGPSQWTFRDLVDRTRREARRLEGHGIARGDVVAVLTGDDPVTFVLRWAANVVGAAAVVAPDGLAAPALAEILGTCRARVLLVDARRADLGAEVAARCARHVDVVDVDATAPPPDASPVEVRIEPDDLAWIRLTGGSTGVPKGIPRLARFMSGLSTDALAGWRDAVQLLCSPVAHLAGTISDVVLAAGGHVVLQAPFDAGRAVAAIARDRVTMMSLTPRLLHRILDHPGLPGTDTSTLRSISVGSAPISAHRLTEAIERFGPIISVGYGTLEVTSISGLSPEELARPELRGTVGRPIPGVEVSLCDDDGAEVQHGAVGEVWVRSHAVMPGYVNAPEQTAAAMRDGWFRTGDLARLDDDGYLVLAGRRTEVILAERAHVYPVAIEESLLRHPGVAAAAVVGVADRDGAESVAAAVVPRPGARPAAEELIAWVGDERGANYAPSEVHFVDDLPTTPSAKVDRGAVREMIGGVGR